LVKPGVVVHLDDTDLDLIAGLQLSPRAGHRALAEALGISVPTVSRRLARLGQERVLRFTVEVPWWVRSDTHPQHVWVSTRTGAAPRVASAVAELEGAQYVAVTAGQSDVYCVLEAARRDDMTHLLTQDLPAVDGVVSTRAEMGLNPFATAAGWRLHRLDSTAEQHLRLDEARLDLPAQETRLRPEEQAAVRMLQSDGRASATDVARTLGVSSSTAYRIISSLFERGITVPRVEVEPSLLGYPLEVVIGMVAEPGTMTALATTLAREPSARYVVTVAGHSSVIYHGLFPHERGLADFLADDVAALPGISALEVSVVLSVVNRYWARQEDNLHTG
jgi:DNA-binding Lrp family transcriptional regulator